MSRVFSGPDTVKPIRTSGCANSAAGLGLSCQHATPPTLTLTQRRCQIAFGNRDISRDCTLAIKGTASKRRLEGALRHQANHKFGMIEELVQMFYHLATSIFILMKPNQLPMILSHQLPILQELIPIIQLS